MAPFTVIKLCRGFLSRLGVVDEGVKEEATMSPRRAVLSILVVAACMLVPRTLLAQRAEGAVAGVVRDPQGAAVAAAKVTITSTSTDRTRETATDDTGFYRVAELPPGPYRVSVSAAGFKLAVAGGILVQVATVTRVDIGLEVGQIAEEVVVTGASRLIQTEEARLSATIDAREVTDLPLNGREVYQLVNLQPGVAATNAPVISNVPSTTSSATFDFGFVANGSTPRSNNFVLDGNSNNNEWLGGTPLLFPSLDAIQEVQVQTLNFSAEYGRNNGAVVNVVTRSGGNALHGSGFYNFRDESLNARNFFDTFEKSPLNHHQFGASLGGPIRRDTTFFFLNYEGSRREDGVPERAVAETPQFRNLVLATRPSSLAAQFLRDFPASACIAGTARDVGSIASPAAGPFAVGPPDGIPDVCDTSFSQVQDHRADQFLARIDHHLGDRDRVSARWIATDASPDVSRQQTFGGTNFRGFGAQLDGFFSDLALDYNRTSATWSNIFRFGWAHNRSRIDFGVPASTSRSTLEAVGTPDFFPQLSLDDGVVGFGGAVYIPREFQFDTLTFADTFSHIKGRHALKYGFEVRHIRENSNYQLETRPFYEFNSVFNFANDQPWLVDALVNRNPQDPGFGDFVDTPRRFRWTQWALFVQDDWRVTPRLTLNVGLRYEVFGGPSEADGRLSNIELGGGADIFEQMAGARVGRVDRMFDVDYNNFAPRLGMAWDVRGDGRTAVRAGFSLAYLEPYSNLYTNASRFDPPDATFLTLFPALGVGTAINYRFPVAPSPDFASPVTANGGAAVANISPSGALGDLKAAYSLQWFVGFQQELGGGFAVAANYVGTRGEDLYIREDWNRYTGDICGAASCDFSEDRLAPGWGQTFLISNGSSSQYHGMNLQVRLQRRRGLSFTANYTLGKVTDEVTEGGLGDYFNVGTPLYTGTMDVRSRQLDKGPSEFDVRHRFAFSGLWDLPGPKEGTAGAVLGGWQLNAIVAYQSGRPFNVYCGLAWFQGCDFNMDGTENDRPNMPANIQTSGFSKEELVGGIFSVSDFCPGGLVPFYLGTPCVPAGTNGDLARNAFRGPSFASVDLALFKNFKLGESRKLQFRWEVFNVFNRVNLYLPVGNLGSPNFGRSLAAFPARQMQLGLRFVF
jgi:outer membrane receptor protein involved in Fe transport